MASSPPLLRTYHLEHLPPTYAINVALFKDVKNAEFLREQLMAGNQDFEYAFINAATIVSTTHALAAAFRAVKDFEDGRLRTRNVHSETVFSLNPSHNITDSFRRFGLSPTTTSLLVIKITHTPTTTPLPPAQTLYNPLLPSSTPSTSPCTTLPTITPSDIQSHLEKNVEGTQIPFNDEEIAQLTDVELVKKNYKLGVPIGSRGEKKGGGGGGGGGGKAASLPFFEYVGKDVKELEVAAMGAMALRSFV